MGPQTREDVAYHVYRLVVAVICSLPFLASRVADGLGYHVFFLIDGQIQWAWATIVLVWAGTPIYAGAYREHKGYGVTTVVLAGAATALYVINTVKVWHPPFGAVLPNGMPLVGFDTMAAMFVTATAGGLVISALGSSGGVNPPIGEPGRQAHRQATGRAVSQFGLQHPKTTSLVLAGIVLTGWMTVGRTTMDVALSHALSTAIFLASAIDTASLGQRQIQLAGLVAAVTGAVGLIGPGLAAVCGAALAVAATVGGKMPKQ